jgi:hypothetical protein
MQRISPLSVDYEGKPDAFLLWLKFSSSQYLMWVDLLWIYKKVALNNDVKIFSKIK